MGYTKLNRENYCVVDTKSKKIYDEDGVFYFSSISAAESLKQELDEDNLEIMVLFVPKEL